MAERKREIIALCWGCGCHRWFPITRITQHHTSLALFLSLSLALCVSLVPTLFGLLDKTTASRSAVCHTQFVNRPMESINHLIRIDSAAAAAVAPVRNSLHRRDTLNAGAVRLACGKFLYGSIQEKSGRNCPVKRKKDASTFTKGQKYKSIQWCGDFNFCWTSRIKTNIISK